MGRPSPALCETGHRPPTPGPRQARFGPFLDRPECGRRQSQALPDLSDIAISIFRCCAGICGDHRFVIRCGETSAAVGRRGRVTVPSLVRMPPECGRLNAPARVTAVPH
jgi:hypothetical protein